MTKIEKEQGFISTVLSGNLSKYSTSEDTLIGVFCKMQCLNILDKDGEGLRIKNSFSVDGCFYPGLDPLGSLYKYH